MLIQYETDILSILSLKLLLNHFKQPENWGNMVKCGHKADSLHFLNALRQHRSVSKAPSPEPQKLSAVLYPEPQ